ncbi:UDP-glucose 4-epimerase GalE [Terrihabitans sp. B22-R8]|uniref:UDP-glucose 4-epimerase GalE n=1 Tax=Terrihabitans sp. B22-R8 TaxID=3425128 RepID=UPI00403C96E8
MKVLVTGGAGYIGSHMVHELLDAGEQVVVLDDLSTGYRWAVPPEAVFVQGDVCDGPLVERIIAEHRIEAIVHFAARIVVPDSVADPLHYYLANTAKTRNLLEAAVRSGVHNIVFSSTAAVYGNPVVNPVGEDAVPAPMSPYGTSKLMSEWMLRDAAFAHDLRYVVLRYFNVAGADPKGRTGQSMPNATHLIKVATQTALGQRAEMNVFGTDYETRDGTCVRDYIHVTDLISAHMCALRHLQNGGESLTLNCGYGTGHSVLEVIDSVKRVSGVDFAVNLAPRRPGDPAKIVAQADRIRRILLWQPEHDDLDRIVAGALDWERRLHNQGIGSS